MFRDVLSQDMFLCTWGQGGSSSPCIHPHNSHLGPKDGIFVISGISSGAYEVNFTRDFIAL